MSEVDVNDLSAWYPSAPEYREGLVTGPPDFVGIGVQRGGTSWWFRLLLQHPQIYFHVDFLTAVKPAFIAKERQFFYRFCHQEFGAEHCDEYHRWFPRPPGQITGEWSPEYLIDFWVPPLLNEAAPDAKLLVMLRDPVERYLSGMRFELRQGASRTNFAEISRIHYDRGLYFDRLEKLLALYDRSQLLVLQQEKCLLEPSVQFVRTLNFLGLDPSFAVPEWLVRAPVNRTTEASANSFELTTRLRGDLTRLYQSDVARLMSAFAELDISLWPNFHLHL